METPEEQNKSAGQTPENLGETPEQEPGSAFTAEPADSQGEATSEEPVGTVTVVPAPPEQPRRSWFQRVLYALFSPETRAGRFMRPFLRVLALVVGVFALGVLSAYLLIYMPANAQLKDAQSQLATVQQQLAGSQSSLATARASTGQLNTQVATLSAQTDAGKTRVHLLLLTTAVKKAQLALINKDGPTAQKSLDTAKQELAKIQPALQKLNPSVAEGLALRLDLASSELVRDPKTAQSDLDILNTNLTLLDEMLAKQFN